MRLKLNTNGNLEFFDNTGAWLRSGMQQSVISLEGNNINVNNEMLDFDIVLPYTEFKDFLGVQIASSATLTMSALSENYFRSSLSTQATASAIESTLSALNAKFPSLTGSEISKDAGGRTRVSQMLTLFDGKILNADNTLIFDNKGTGTGAFTSNKYNMAVTSGQWLVRQGKRFCNYLSGKSQLVECTFDNFQVEANVNKKVGYFSSNAVTPFATDYDGFWLENDGITLRLMAHRAGVETINVPFASWDNYALLSTYNFSNFTVIAFDFLWLGGAILRLFVKTNQGFILAHTVHYSGTSTDTFIKSPNQPIRYEIRSSTGAGSLRYICCQVSSEGSEEEAGYNNCVVSLSTNAVPSNTVATIGTVYPLKAIRKKATFRDNQCLCTGAFINVSSANDILLWSLQLNPTLSAPLTYVDLVPLNGIEQANGSASAAISITVTTEGKKLAGGICNVNQSIAQSLFTKDFLQNLGCTIDNVMDQLVLCVQPVTANITVNGGILLKEY